MYDVHFTWHYSSPAQIIRQRTPIKPYLYCINRCFPRSFYGQILHLFCIQGRSGTQNNNWLRIRTNGKNEDKGISVSQIIIIQQFDWMQSQNEEYLPGFLSQTWDNTYSMAGNATQSRAKLQQGTCFTAAYLLLQPLFTSRLFRKH